MDDRKSPVVGDGTPIQTAVPVGAEEAEASVDITPPVFIQGMITLDPNEAPTNYTNSNSKLVQEFRFGNDIGVTASDNVDALLQVSQLAHSSYWL